MCGLNLPITFKVIGSQLLEEILYSAGHRQKTFYYSEEQH